MTGSVACSSDPGEQVQPVVHEAAPVPKDRDPAAVLAALRKLDACALLGPAPGRTPIGPHGCGTAARLSVRLGAALPMEARDKLELSVIGGAKAYRNLPLWTDACEVYLPVSFTQAIRITGKEKPKGCAATEKAAATAVRVLAKPVAIPVIPAAARWDACTVLGHVLGASAGKLAPGEAGLDDCEQVPANPSDMAAVDRVATLSFRYGPLLRYRDTESLGGRKIHALDAGGNGCRVTWNQGSSGAKNLEREIELRAANCSEAKRLAVATMKTLSTAPPAGPGFAGALTYGVIEPDSPRAGGCGNLPVKPACEPYHPVDVPSGGAVEVMRQVDADPNVLCAIAVDMVWDRLGPRFQPVTRIGVDERTPECVFVEPSRELQVTVGLTDGWKRPPAGPEAKEFSGRPGVVEMVTPKLRSATVGVTTEIHLSVMFWFDSPRGTKKPADVGRSAELEPLTNAIVGKYF